MGRFDSAASDAETIASIGWTESDGCAAVTLAFRTTEGAPAVEPPSVRAEFLRHTGVIRLELGNGVSESTISDQLIDTALLRAIFVATDPNSDALIVDLHLWDAALARVQTFTSPARVVIELERGGPDLIQRARFGPSTVVFFPAQESAPFVLAGYGVGGGALDARVASTAGQQVTAFDLAQSPTAWTTYEWTVRSIEPGLVEVRVGDAPSFAFTAR